jgi:hypothetical protein
MRVAKLVALSVVVTLIVAARDSQAHRGGYRGLHGGHHFHRHHAHGFFPGGAFALGLVGGGLAGAAIVRSAPYVSYPSTFVYPPSVVYGPPVGVVSSSAIVSNVPLSVPVSPATLAVTPLAVPVSPPPAPGGPAQPEFGTVYSSLPVGCVFEPVNTQPYYRCGSYWYRAQFGPQGPQFVFSPRPDTE